jgi:hypothetical protein
MMDWSVQALEQSFLRTKAKIPGLLPSPARPTAPTTLSLPIAPAPSPICIRSSSRGATTGSIIPKSSTAATAHRLGSPTDHRLPTSSTRPTAGSTPTTGLSVVDHSPKAQDYPRYMTGLARTTVACMPAASER